MRLFAIANALGGMGREAAAGAAGMDRQRLRDWVVRFNEEDVTGLRDPAPPQAARLGSLDRVGVSAVARSGAVQRRRPDLAQVGLGRRLDRPG